MLDYLNSAACLALMLFSLPVAVIMPARGVWAERVSLAIVEIGLFCQVVTPWVDWLPQVSWITALLNVSTAVMLGCFWRKFWLFVRTQFEEVPKKKHPFRRTTDYGTLDIDLSKIGKR